MMLIKKKKSTVWFLALFASCLFSGSALAEPDVQVIEVPAQPVQVDPSTTTKRDPTGDPVSDYKPAPPPLNTTPPPPPTVDRNNPTGDPDVQRGFDEHQRQYNP